MQYFEHALIVVGRPNDELVIYGINGFLMEVKQNIQVYIERKCRYFGSDIVTATCCVKKKLHVRKNIPLCVSQDRKIILFKIVCPISKQPIWFRYSPKMKYKRIEGDRFGIFYDNELLIETTFSKHKFDTQIKRAEKFIMCCVACENCPKFGCTDCNIKR